MFKDSYYDALYWATKHVKTLPWYDPEDVVHTAYVYWYDKYGYNLFRSSDRELIHNVIRRTASFMKKRYSYHPSTLRILAGVV